MSDMEQEMKRLRGQELGKALEEHRDTVVDWVVTLVREDAAISRKMIKSRMCTILQLSEFPDDCNEQLKSIVADAVTKYSSESQEEEQAAEGKETKESKEGINGNGSKKWTKTDGEEGERGEEEDVEEKDGGKGVEEEEGDEENEAEEDSELEEEEEAEAAKKKKASRKSSKRKSPSKTKDQPSHGAQKKSRRSLDSGSDGSDVEDGPSDKNAASRAKSAEPATAEEKRLEFLKRCVRECGRHVNYAKLFPPDSSTSRRVRLLEDAIRAFGVRGAINLKNCKKLVEDKELEELQRETARIVGTGGRARLGRGARRGHEEESSSDHDHAAPKRTSIDTSFLGQDSESD